MDNWFGALIISFIIVVFLELFIGAIVIGFVAGISNDSPTAHTWTLRILVIIGIIAILLLTPAIENSFGSGDSDSGRKYSNSSSAHSCCICGEQAYSKYGNDYWCVEHYYMAKASENDLSP